MGLGDGEGRGRRKAERDAGARADDQRDNWAVGLAVRGMLAQRWRVKSEIGMVKLTKKGADLLAALVAIYNTCGYTADALCLVMPCNREFAHGTEACWLFDSTARRASATQPAVCAGT